MRRIHTLGVAAVAIAALSACAAGGPKRESASIDFRGGSRPGATTNERGTDRRDWGAPVRDPTSVSSMPSVQEAAALQPEFRSRPGGEKRQPPDNRAARAIKVTRGMSLYVISSQHSVNIRALIETNHLSPPYDLEVGQVIYLPPPNIHVVLRGETLYSVSRRYNVDTRSLAVMNGLKRPWTVYPGDELRLPALARDEGGQRLASTPKSTNSSSVKVASTKVPTAVVAAARPGGFAENPAGNHNFIWPVSGRVIRMFGESADGQKNDGVNISARRNDDVVSTASGEVVYAGSELVGFGNLILIQHTDGWISAYGHAESLLVRVGDRVRQGQAIAKAGATGNATEPQVHFELRRGQAPVDPTAHLPKLKV